MSDEGDVFGRATGPLPRLAEPFSRFADDAFDLAYSTYCDGVSSKPCLARRDANGSGR